MRAMRKISIGLSILLLAALSGPALAQTTYKYDEVGRLTKVVAPDGTTTTYQYDDAGNRIGRIVTIGGSGGFNQTIQVTSTGPVNLRALAEAAGYSGGQDATITFEVGNGVVVAGTSGGGTAIDTGIWPTGYDVSLNLVVKTGGIVRGGGGSGGSGNGGSGGAGGDAVYCRAPLSVTVESGGEISAGGGGGGGSSTFADGLPEPQVYGGGGGGGGAPNGAGGGGGTGDPGLDGNDGAPGTASGGGAGGWGGGNLTKGGGGGNYGAAGTKGSDYYSEYSGGWAYGGSGGAPGYAIRANGYTVNVANNGTIIGTVEGTPVNQPPVAGNDSISVTAGVAHDFSPLGNDSDPEGGQLTITAKTNGSKGTVTILSGTQLRYTANAGTSGSDSFTYTIQDPQGASDTATVAVTISAANQPPVAGNDSISVTAGVAHDFNPLGNDSDPEGGQLTITAKTNGSKGTVTILSGTQLRYTANAGTSGSDSFTYTIQDPQGASDTATVTVTISAPSNSPPVALADSATVFAGSAKVISVLSNDSDPDGDPLEITAVTQGAKGSVSLWNNNTQVRYFAFSNSSGTDSFTYTISDGNGGQDTATVTMTISGGGGGGGCGEIQCP